MGGRCSSNIRCGFTRVLNIGNITGVIISNRIGNSLGTAIGKKDIV